MWAILWQVFLRFWLLEGNVAEEVTGFHPYTTEEHLEPTQMYGFLQDDVFVLSCLLLLVCPFFLEFHRLLQTEISHLGFDKKEFTRRHKRVRNRSKSCRDELLQTRRVLNMKPKRRPKILPLVSMESIKCFASFLKEEKVTPATTETPTVEHDKQCLHKQEGKPADVKKPRKVKSGQTKTSPISEPETPPKVSVHEEKVIPIRQKDETARPIPCPRTQDHSKITCPHSRSIRSCGCGRNPRLGLSEQLMAEFLEELEKVKNQVKDKFSNETKSSTGDSSDRKMSPWLREQMENQQRTVIETTVRDVFNNIPRNIAGDQTFSGQRALAIESTDGKESRSRVTPEQNDKKEQHQKKDQKPKDSRYNIQADIPSCCLGCFSFIFG